MTFYTTYSKTLSKIHKWAYIGMLASLSGCSGSPTKSIGDHENFNAVLWVQTAAEFDVLFRTTYRAAASALPTALADPAWTAALEQQGEYSTLPPAIIVDIDETVLDNSPFAAKLIRDRASFNRDAWESWTQLASASTLPGAQEYLTYANSLGVTIFYVTNRDVKEEEDTRRNLTKNKLPLRNDIDVVLTKNEYDKKSSDKSPRRTRVASNFRVLALIGDDLGDFTHGAHSTPSTRKELIKQYDLNWGAKWFLLPNPVYGSWEGALTDFDYSLPTADKLTVKYKHLKLP